MRGGTQSSLDRTRLWAALSAGSVAAVLAFAAVRITRPPTDAQVGRLFGQESTAQLFQRLVLNEIPIAVRVGLACALIVLVGDAAWRARRLNPLALGACSGMAWILIVSFLQQVLLNLRVNVASAEANTFWLVAYFVSIVLVLAFIVAMVSRINATVADR